MGTYTPDQYQQEWRRRAVELKRQGLKTTQQVAQFLIRSAKGMAPKKTGATRAGLRVRPKKDGHIAESYVPGEFKQNMFANQTAPYRTVDYPRGAWLPPNKSYTGKWLMIAPPGTKAVYGQSPNWKWTGTPRFFHLATVRASQYNSKIARRNTQKALRVNIT